MTKSNYVKVIDKEIKEAQERVDMLNEKKVNYNKLSPIRKLAVALFLRYEVDCIDEWEKEEIDSNSLNLMVWDLSVHKFWTEEAETLMEFIKSEML